MKNLSYDVIFIEWVDVITDTFTWKNIEDILTWVEESNGHCYSVGVLITEDDDFVVMVSGIMPLTNEDILTDIIAHGSVRIPKKWILNRYLLGNVNMKDGFSKNV